MSQLPNAALAHVEDAKVRNYLLNPGNLQNQGKAGQFGQYGFVRDQWQILADALWECQKPGALRRELDCLLAKASVQHCGPDLEHAMGAAGRPAHLPSLVHAGVDQVVNRAFRT